MKKLRIFVILGCLLALSLAFTACSGGPGDPGDPGGGGPVAVTGVTLDEGTLSLFEGGEATLTETVTPSNATNKSVSWSSDDEDIATVEGGVVSAVAAGETTITVTTVDGGYTAECTVTVKPVPVSIEITQQPTKTTYKIYESLDIDGLEVTATYSDETTEVVAITVADITGFDSSEAGEQTLTVTYGGIETTFTVTVVGVSSIAVTQDPTKTAYKLYEPLNIDGIEVTATYEDDSTETVDITGANITGFDSTTAGQKTITVSYGDKEATFTVTVVGVSSIAVTQNPTKTAYVAGESLNLAGIVVTATYEDSSTAAVTITAANITGFDTATEGEKTLTVTYGGKTATFTITVTVPTTPGLAFELIDDGTAYRVRKGSVTSGVVYIPAAYDGLPVTEIGKIGDDAYGGAFSSYTSFTAVYIPSSVTTIGDFAFRDCSSLVSVTIGEGVTTIGTWAFYGCTGLTEITIPASVTSISYNAFHGCTISTVIFEEGFSMSIGSWFSGSSFNNLHIPASVTSIDNYMFANCTNLTNITVSENSPNYAGEDGILYNKTKTGLLAWPSANGNITIPEGVTSIGSNAFYGNTSLTSVTFVGNQLLTIGGFSGCTGLTEITIPAGVTSIGSEAFYNCTGLTSVTIGENVTSIGSYAFYNCTSLTEISIPSSVTSIGSEAFGRWTVSQTIYVEGLPSQGVADAVWGTGWRVACNAIIVYGREPELEVIADITVTNADEWDAALNIIRNGGFYKAYTIIIGGSFSVSGSTANTFGSAPGIEVTLKGSGTVSLNSNGNLIRIYNAYQTLIIDSENVTLQGKSANNNSLVSVSGSDAKLELRNGTITGNAGSSSGGGVYVQGNGTFIMSGGTISGNTVSGQLASGGGGVSIYSGNFTMSGGTISGNSVTFSAADQVRVGGGGVLVNGSGIFTMTGGTISGNRVTITSTFASSYARGGGVYVDVGVFRLVSGTIYGTNESTTALRNTVARTNSGTATGAALYGTAQLGYFDASGEWVSSGTLSTSENTIQY